MLKARLTFDNARGRVEADPAILRDLRPLVAYRELDLPPVEVQRIVNEFFRKQTRRWGMLSDHQRLFDAPEVGPRLQAMGWGPDRLTPRMFETVMRTPGVWDGWSSLITPGGYFGAGLVAHVERALSMRLGVAVEVVDNRAAPPPQPLGGEPDLFEFQREAVDAWFASGCRGVIDLPPRSGKTRIAISIIMRLGLPALIVVPTRNLVTQTVERLREWLPADQVQGITGGRPNAKKQRRLNHALVWVATPATAAGPKPKRKGARRPGMDGIRSRQVLVIDEFHHAAAATWQDISHTATEAYYRLGLTGTHFRADGKDLAMHAVLSRCVYRRTVSEMVELGRLVPARIAMVRVHGETSARGHDLYAEGVVDHPHRNGLAAVAANWLTYLGKRVLVLTKEVRHAEALAAQIDGAVQVDGRDNSVVAEHLRALQEGKIRCMVGTSVIGEGVDVPAADALIYVAGGRSPVKHKQDYFRVLTASEGKSHGIVVDFADVHHPTLEEAAAQRLGLYRSEAVFSAEVLSPEDLPAWLQRAV